jgi:hypothetical protein
MWLERSSSGNFPGGPAPGADAEDSQTVMCRLKFVLSGNLILLLFYDFAIKLDQISADGADQMVMMVVVEIVFVPHTSVTEALFTGQPTFVQKLERSVYSRKTDRWIFCLDQFVEVFSAQVPLSPEKDFKYEVPLCSPLESRAPQMINEYLFFF